MKKNEKFNFTNVIYKFRGKNGTVYFNKDNQIYIERWGWFDIPYQLFTQGETLFNLDEIEKIVIKEPDMVRGYMDFLIKGKKKARVWLTRPGYIPYARKMQKLLEERMR